MVGVVLFEDLQKTFASRDIDALMSCIVKHIVSVAHTWKAHQHLVRARIKNKETRRLPGDYKQPVIGLIKDRKSTRLNSSHLVISYAVFCLKKKKKKNKKQ